MIISKTPLRISFVGGGSDIPDLLDGFNGNVISTTINKYIYTMINPKHNNKVRISYSKTENVEHVKQIKNPIIREGLKFFKIKKGIEVVTVADIPTSGSGLGSSSSLMVGILKCLYNQKNASLNTLVKKAFFIERNLLKKNIGLQDPCNAVFGGFNHFSFKKNKEFSVSKIDLSKKKMTHFKNNLILFYTGINRKADKILNNIKLNENKKNIHETSNLALEFKNNLVKNNINELGRILHESWIIKKKLDKNVSSSFINEVYSDAIKVGALGGKILGAGGGGYFLFLIDKNLHNKLEKKLFKLKKIEFDFENKGSEIIYHD